MRPRVFLWVQKLWFSASPQPSLGRGHQLRSERETNDHLRTGRKFQDTASAGTSDLPGSRPKPNFRLLWDTADPGGRGGCALFPALCDSPQWPWVEEKITMSKVGLPEGPSLCHEPLISARQEASSGQIPFLFYCFGPISGACLPWG